MKEDFNQEEITPEVQAQMDEINTLLNKPQIEPTQALNIIINAVQVCYTSEIFNDLDKALISKALGCFQDKIEKNENFEIKVNEN
jgi:hypothetical protein